LPLRHGQKEIKKCITEQWTWMCKMRNILATGGEDEVRSSTKHDSKISLRDTTVKAIRQEIYAERSSLVGFALLHLFMWQICRVGTADTVRFAVFRLATTNTVCP
jgi:hypothetical protein